MQSSASLFSRLENVDNCFGAWFDAEIPFGVDASTLMASEQSQANRRS
jgi:hypothetical protein